MLHFYSIRLYKKIIIAHFTILVHYNKTSSCPENPKFIQENLMNAVKIYTSLDELTS